MLMHAEPNPPDSGNALKSNSNSRYVPLGCMCCRFSAANGVPRSLFRGEGRLGATLAGSPIYDVDMIKIERCHDKNKRRPIASLNLETLLKVVIVNGSPKRKPL